MYNYNKKRFRKIICKKCKLCKGKPVFCYNTIYKIQPRAFISNILPKLIKLKKSNIDYNIKDVVINLFCNMFICTISHGSNTGCYKINKCAMLFKSQFNTNKIFKKNINMCEVQNKPKNAIPHFFCNTDNKEWLKELEQYS